MRTTHFGDLRMSALQAALIGLFFKVVSGSKVRLCAALFSLGGY